MNRIALETTTEPQSLAMSNPKRVRFFHVFGRIWRFCKDDWPKLLLIFLVTPLINAALQAALALFSMLLMDDAFARRNYGAVVLIVSLITATTALFHVNFLVEGFMRYNVKMMAIRRMGTMFYSHMMRHSVAFHSANPVGERIFRTMTDVHDASRLIGVSLPQSISFLLQGTIAAVLTMMVDWRPVVAVVIFLPLYILVSQYVTRLWQRADFDQRDTRQRVVSQLQTSYSNIMVVKASSREGTERSKYARTMVPFLRAYFRWFCCASVNEAFIIPAGFALIYAMLCTFAWGYMHMIGILTLGQWFAIQILTTNIIVPLSQIVSISQILQREMVSAERVLSVLEIEPELQEPRRGRRFEQFEGSVDFRGVDFHFDPLVPLLKDFDFKLEPDKFNVIVGSSGCGKSILLQMILRFYDPQRGEVRADGVPLRDLALDDYRRQIGYLPQNPHLMAGTIRDNLRYGCESLDDEALWEALRVADCEDFVRSLPGGLDYELGEKSEVSGGQKQRLGLARALARRPRLLLLDEPFASLDAATEHRIKAPLREFMRGCTCLLVTHHVHSVADADIIHVMEEGRILESGSHEQLLTAGGTYAQRLAGPEVGDPKDTQ